MRFRTIGFAAGVFALALATTASAQEFPPALDVSTITNPAAAQALENQVSGSTLKSGTFGGQAVHQTGVGIRLGNAGFGIGATARIFFGGPIGVQVEFLHSGFVTYSVNEFQAAVLYRLKDLNVMPDKLILTPYLGGGVSFVKFSCCDTFLGDEFDDELDIGDSDTGVVVLGGVEAFFAQVPKLGVSFQITFNSADTLDFGGAGGSLAAHWYFK